MIPRTTRAMAALLLVLAWGAAALAQGPPPPTPVAGASPVPSVAPSPSPTLVFDLPPLDVPSRGAEWWEEPALFQMASGGGLEGDGRERRVLDRVEQMAREETEAPEVVVDQSLGITVLRAGDQVLATVLPEDLPDYYRALAPDKRRLAERQLGEMWARALQQALAERIMWRTPEFRWITAVTVAVLLIFAILANAAIRWVADRYLATPMWSFRALVWMLWLAVSLSMVPEFQGLQYALAHGVLGPLWLLITAGIASSLVFQVCRALIHRYFRSLAELQQKRRALQAHRLASLEGAWVFALRMAVTLGAVLFVLSGLDVSLSHFLAGAGLVGAALTLVFQDLLRDLTAGANILAEEQFAVGDWIEAGGLQGTVEAFHLRATRLRNTDGTASIVPNSNLRIVTNHSMHWSQVDYRVTVDMLADAEAALKMLEEEATVLAGERSDQVMELPQVLGLQTLGPDGVTLRLLLKTRPLQQWDVSRQLNRRVLARFRREGVALASRRHALHLEDPVRLARDGQETAGHGDRA